MTQTACDAVTATWTINELRTWQTQARYPQLLIEAPARADGVVYRRVRDGTGLVITALRHDALAPAQAEALAEFRLQQYVLCGWYDLDALERRGTIADPAFEHLPWNTIHVLAGTASGHLLAYFCMQPANLDVSALDATGLADLGALDSGSHRTPLMGDASRPLFPTEIHSFSPRVFTSLPALRAVPVQRVRELTRLLRNQTSPSLLSAIAVVEAVCAMTAVAMNPESEIAVMLGCVDREARQVTAHLGIPILFAPLAPTIPLPPAEHEFYWAASANEQGRFWPFVIATDDLTSLTQWFGEIDSMLAGSSRDVRRGIVELRRCAHGPQRLSLARDLESSPVFWTADIFYESHAVAASETSVHQRDVAPVPVGVPAPGPTHSVGKRSRPARRRSSRRETAATPARQRRSRRRSSRRSRRASARRPAAIRVSWRTRR